MSATKADIPVETLILHVTLQKNQLNLMGLVHAMRSNGPLPQVLYLSTSVPFNQMLIVVAHL